ncbi:hypothetical protein CKA32_000991 [Geitlerinema sp. FC II]|nr:hypothetical protein CKA32_000991 [Geitlerinema sp. FC II]
MIFSINPGTLDFTSISEALIEDRIPKRRLIFVKFCCVWMKVQGFGRRVSVFFNFLNLAF